MFLLSVMISLSPIKFLQSFFKLVHLLLCNINIEDASLRLIPLIIVLLILFSLLAIKYSASNSIMCAVIFGIAFFPSIWLGMLWYEGMSTIYDMPIVTNVITLICLIITLLNLMIDAIYSPKIIYSNPQISIKVTKTYTHIKLNVYSYDKLEDKMCFVYLQNLNNRYTKPLKVKLLQNVIKCDDYNGFYKCELDLLFCTKNLKYGTYLMLNNIIYKDGLYVGIEPSE